MGRNQVRKDVAALDIRIAGTVTREGRRVPGKRMSMRKTREVLRLYFELKAEATPRSPARQRQPEHGARVRGAFSVRRELSWPLPAGKCRSRIWKESIFQTTPASPGRAPKTHLISPTFISNCRHKHTTLQLLWEEYRAGHVDGMGTSRFCHHYQRFKQERDLAAAPVPSARREVVLSIGRERPFPLRSTTGQAARGSCSWLCWEPATTPMPRLRWISRWQLDRSTRAGVGSFSAAPAVGSSR